ncbi:MAG TPA: molybdopterin-dependent oxidoreductase [Terriglobales bacterium]|nr:molybdopterin-dependent oxidoreductase [Terriglobales bacterium]
MKKSRALTGGLVGSLLTAPMIAFFHLGWKLFKLPFAPFDLFDWIARMLPGSVITFGIDLMVKVIHALGLGNTSAVGKMAEQSMAIIIFLVSGGIAGAFLFALLRVWKKSSFVFGIILGVSMGVLMLLINSSLEKTGIANSLLQGLWILALFLVWGVTLGWVHRRLSVKVEIVPGLEESEARQGERIDRRRFLIRLGSTSAAITVAGAVVSEFVGQRRKPEVVNSERWSAHNVLPNANASVTPAPGTRPEYTPLEQHYRIDIDTTPPIIKEENWRLKIGGLVKRPLELTLEDIHRHEPMHQFITMACISNPVGGDLIGTTRWTGVSLQRLLPIIRPESNATHFRISAVDGFFETIALEKIRNDERVMLTYAWDGVPLPPEQGFPLRIYIPDLYGMKQPKWIESIEATDHWEEGYWVVRGWDKEARMKTTSVIDTIAVGASFINEKGQMLVPVGGIAHAGARGISRVEVKVDDAKWIEAQLRTPLSELTWVIWRYDMPFRAGEHVLTVRCYDGNGTMQIVESSPPHPSGATGLHSRKAKL